MYYMYMLYIRNPVHNVFKTMSVVSSATVY